MVSKLTQPNLGSNKLLEGGLLEEYLSHVHIAS